jgi:hypothetical protein
MAEGKAPASATPASEPDVTKRGDAVRKGGTRAVGAALPALVRNAFRRQGFAATEVVTRWAAIVGERVAARTVPEKVTFPAGKNAGGTLHVRVDGPLATELQHVEPQVIERVNAFYGYPAIAHLAIKQGRLPPSRRRVPPRPRALSDESRALLEGAVGGTRDDGLRDALERLGRRILAADRR